MEPDGPKLSGPDSKYSQAYQTIGKLYRHAKMSAGHNKQTALILTRKIQSIFNFS